MGVRPTAMLPGLVTDDMYTHVAQYLARIWPGSWLPRSAMACGVHTTDLIAGISINPLQYPLTCSHHLQPGHRL